MDDKAKAGKKLGTADIVTVMKLLPHRYPFLLVDRVDEIGEDRLVARKLVSRNEPFFNGHFPGHPVMPGVLIIEALAQAGALLAAHVVAFSQETHVVYFMAIDNARFRKPVVPGDVLMLDVVPLRKGKAIWKLKGEGGRRPGRGGRDDGLDPAA